ncbi:response regulator [uncultured Desulfosarcina sp.]|uniref:response regulator n=1 Tax=uncultured Desulfosarcina sp. TaxID=218289 RepID=UPI0029C7ADF0|nr:response regulator [uncultured Desulfosarcina sp.]
MTSSTTSTDQFAFNDQTPLYNSGIIGNYINYLESHHVDLDTDDLLHRSGLTRFDINDEGHFLNQEQINRFHRCLDAVLTDPKISYKVGRHALYMKSTGTIKRYGLQFLTPGAMYRAVDRLYPKWSRGHVIKTTVTGKGRADVVVSVRPGVREKRFQCENRQGIFEAIGNILTRQPAQVSHPTCMHRGDDACRYLISWREKSSAIWKRMGAYAGILAIAVASGMPFFMPARSWIVWMLAMGVTCLSILLFGYWLEKKEYIELLKEQGDTAGNLLEEIEARYHNARLVQEIGLAGADILEVGTFLNTVLESMSRNLDFPRGMISLCDDGCSRLHHAANFGFSRAEQKFLEGMDFPIDLKNASDVFVQSLQTGRPVFLNDIHRNIDGMTPNSINLIETLNVDALISVPLIHKKEPLGLLIVDTQGSKKNHTTSDVNLLMGIAAQVATGIVNARSFSRLQESEQRYRLLAENVMDVIWILDLKTLKLKYVSPSVEKALGYTPDEMISLSMDQYLTPESFQRAADALGKAMDRSATRKLDAQSYSMTLELDEYHKNGTLLPIEITAGFIMDENHQPNAVLGISRDLSERKRSENERAAVKEKLQQAKKMESLGTMAGSIAHNFNNLLMVVLGNLELAQEDLPEASAAARNIQRAAHASQRAADLSGMMLTYVGQLKKESIPVDLSQMVNTVLKNLDESKMANVTLDMDLADPMPLVAADADQMRQMIAGFITNAIEALGNEKGRVRISTGSMHCDKDYLSTTYLKGELSEGIYAYVEVADTGQGMDAETLGKVFDPFFSTKFTGRGLGMAAVMGIIRSHNGAVKVSSVKNEGSVFTALFPIQGISLRPMTIDKKDDKAVAEGRTVLLVDDEAMVMDIGSQFLKRLGYSVRMASDGRQALDIFRQESDSIDCLLLDFTMPGMDGLETMQQIKKIRSDAKIIITSGYTRQQIEDQFSGIGPPDDFIQKPFEMKALQEKLCEVISRTTENNKLT